VVGNRIIQKERKMERIRKRFEKFFDKGPIDDCWVWKGALSHNGYGRFRTPTTHKKAHRIAYELYVGPFKEYLNVLHTCDNPSCVNPNHLFVGTQLDNTKDRDKKGRGKNGLPTLSFAQIKRVREFASVGIPRKTLADFFTVDKSSICRIINRTTYDYI
jgi:hypothetical protein